MRVRKRNKKITLEDFMHIFKMADFLAVRKSDSKEVRAVSLEDIKYIIQSELKECRLKKS